MKKVLPVISAVLLAALLLASCASESPSGASAAAAPSSYASFGSAYEYDVEMYKYKSSSNAPMPAPSAAPDGTTISGTPLATADDGDILFSEKIIYSYNATIETISFDETIENIEGMLGQYGALLENSYVSGNSYGKTSFRTADYTIRVPVKNFTPMTDGLSVLGNIVNERKNAQNITAQFTDTESRLKTYKTEETRLLAMLEKADTVADMITIESKLADVRYQIESLTSTLRNWQNQVDYSYVTLHIIEVDELSQQNPVRETYWQQISRGFSDTLKGIGTFFKGLFKALVIALPVLAIIAVIVVVVIINARVARKRRNKPE